MSATLEWLKPWVVEISRPTLKRWVRGLVSYVMICDESKLDYFGNHIYDVKGKAEKGREKGQYHTEFAST